MEMKNYSKKKLYSILRAAIVNCANFSFLSCLVSAYYKKDKNDLDKVLLTIFNITKEELNDFNSFDSYPRDYESSRPSFFTLNRNEMCNIIKNLILKFHDEDYMELLRGEVKDFEAKHSADLYLSPTFILKLFELRPSEYNEIINYEESLALQGTKDNGLDELNEETRSVIAKFLIRY